MFVIIFLSNKERLWDTMSLNQFIIEMHNDSLTLEEITSSKYVICVDLNSIRELNNSIIVSLGVCLINRELFNTIVSVTKSQLISFIDKSYPDL